ncbi:hypothetical protein ABZ738_31470 [Micromonospora sp. NPDC047793]|uniref:hypothetical protein n=1 Tax=Micromonospora sp. NPDC047793 TaxID=3154342 RepID=UPI0033FEDF3B
MPSINWDTVATAAATAIFVTLAVEYAAKPRLEARKERILAVHRSRRELAVAVRGIAVTSAFLALDLPKDAAGDVRAQLLAERARKHEQMRDQAQAMFDVGDSHAATYPGWVMESVMSYITTVQGVMLSARTQHDKACLIRDLSQHMAVIVDARILRPLAFMNARAGLDALVAKTHERDGEPNPVPATRRG